MAEYESGSEMDSKDDSYISKEASEMGDEIYDESEKYDSHDDVINMLKAAQWADHDNREKAREAHLFVSKRDGQWEPYWWNNNINKPRYTFDMASPIVDQIAGELEQADFDVKVSPALQVASNRSRSFHQYCALLLKKVSRLVLC